MGSVIDLQHQSGPSTAASSSATFGAHGAQEEPTRSALGLIYEGGEDTEDKQAHLVHDLSASQLYNTARSASFKRRTVSKGLSERDMDRHPSAPGRPPPQGPLPLPDNSPLDRTIGGQPDGYIEQERERDVEQYGSGSRIDVRGI